MSLALMGIISVMAAPSVGAQAAGPKVKCVKAPCYPNDPDTTPPSAPTNLTIQEVVVGDQWGARLQWAAATDDYYMGNYEVVRMNNLDHSVDGFMLPHTQTSYDDLYFRVNSGALVDYSYIVVAHDAAGNASVPSNEVHYPKRTTLAADLLMTNDRWGARLSWSALPELGEVDHFVITRNDSFASPTDTFTVPGNQYSYDDLMFIINTGASMIFYYTVTAYDEHGNFIYTSNSAVFDTDQPASINTASIVTNVEDGAVLQDYAELQADVVNGPAIERYEFFLDDYYVFSTDGQSAYSYLDTYGFGDGEYALTIRAYDAENNFVEKVIAITISNYGTIH